MAETPPKTDSGSANPLDEFLKAAEDFVKNISAAMVRAAGDHEDGILIDGTSKVVIAQLASVCQEVRSGYRSANVTARQQADHFLSMQQGTLLARTGEQTGTAALKKAAGKGILGWISQHLREIKKLIRFIVEMFVGRVPAWLDKLLTLIDELWDLIVSILGGIFGHNAREVADDISARSVNTMNELAALARLEQARKGGAFESDD